MFGLNAHFSADSVYIDERAYKPNEVLTFCLNLSTGDLEEIVSRLFWLRGKVQLQMGGDQDYCDAYDSYVQEAQNLFYRIGNLALKIPVYKKHLRDITGIAWLVETLDTFPYWDDAEDEHFSPDVRTLESDDPNIVLEIKELNEHLAILFDEYIFFAYDLIRVQKGYTDLLDNYIHTKSRYLSEREQAETYRSYLEGVEQKKDYERVVGTSTMTLSYEPYRFPGEPDKLCESFLFDSLGTFLYVDFFRGLRLNHIPKRCDNCGKYFLIAGGKYNNYCERVLKDDPDKKCRDIGARRKYDEKCKDNPVWLAYNRAYKTHYARYMKKKMTAAQFEQWSRQTVEWRNAAAAGKLPQAEYERIIKV